MRSIEVSGKTVEDAVQAGLKELNKDSSQVAIDVLEYGSPGLFGMFGKLARVRLVVKEDEDEFDFDMPVFSLDQQPEKKQRFDKKPEARAEQRGERKPEPKASAAEPRRGDAPERPAPKAPAPKAPAPILEAQVSDAVSLLDRMAIEPELKRDAADRPQQRHPRRRGGRGGEGRPTRDDAPRGERASMDRSSAPQGDRARAGRTDQGRPPRPDVPREPRRTIEPTKMEDLPPLDFDALSETGKSAHEFLSKLTKLMNVDVEIRMRETEGQLTVQMIGDTLGVLIGRRGETLDALQYLTSLQVNKNRDEYLRVTLDTEHYRAKREEALIHLAERMANRARKTGHRVALEPMNPYERRVLHSALQDHPSVTTHSEGEEPYRRVVITLK